MLVVVICWYWSFVIGKSHLYYFYMPLFALYAALFYGSFLIWSWREEFAPVRSYFVPKSPVIALIALVFFFNGANPYLGLKTESAIAMYSNLRTEGGKSNHFFHRSPPYMADYQERLVKVVSTNSRYLKRFKRKDWHMVELEFERFIERRPKTKVVYTIDGQQFEYGPKSTYTPKYSSAENGLKFKPAVFTKPKRCSH